MALVSGHAKRASEVAHVAKPSCTSNIDAPGQGPTVPHERSGAFPFHAMPLQSLVQRLHHHPSHPAAAFSMPSPDVPDGPRERRDARDAERAQSEEPRRNKHRGQHEGYEHRAEDHEERCGERETGQGRRHREPRGAQQRGTQRDEEGGRGHARASPERRIGVQAPHASQRVVPQAVWVRLLVAMRPR